MKQRAELISLVFPLVIGLANSQNDCSSLCADGTPVSFPDNPIAGEERTCQETQDAWNSVIAPETCAYYQTWAFVDCGCPTLPLDVEPCGYCEAGYASNADNVVVGLNGNFQQRDAVSCQEFDVIVALVMERWRCVTDAFLSYPNALDCCADPDAPVAPPIAVPTAAQPVAVPLEPTAAPVQPVATPIEPTPLPVQIPITNAPVVSPVTNLTSMSPSNESLEAPSEAPSTNTNMDSPSDLPSSGDSESPSTDTANEPSLPLEDSTSNAKQAMAICTALTGMLATCILIL